QTGFGEQVTTNRVRPGIRLTGGRIILAIADAEVGTGYRPQSTRPIATHGTHTAGIVVFIERQHQVIAITIAERHVTASTQGQTAAQREETLSGPVHLVELVVATRHGHLYPHALGPAAVREQTPV